jgi:hypothetical protein
MQPTLLSALTLIFKFEIEITRKLGAMDGNVRAMQAATIAIAASNQWGA